MIVVSGKIILLFNFICFNRRTPQYVFAFPFYLLFLRLILKLVEMRSICFQLFYFGFIRREVEDLQTSQDAKS